MKVSSTDRYNCFMAHKNDWPTIRTWLMDNEIEYVGIYNLKNHFGFSITAESEEQKQHLVWFKLKWMHNESS